MSSAACSVYDTDSLPSSAHIVSSDASIDAQDGQPDADVAADGSADLTLPSDAGSAEGDIGPAEAAEPTDMGSGETSADVASEVQPEGGAQDAQSEVEPATADGADASAVDAADGTADAGVLVEAGREAGGTVVFSDNFEDEDAGATPATGWTRVGGSSADWVVADDMGRVFRQDKSLSTTFRACHAGPVLRGAATVSARAKVTLNGVSGPSAFVCVRYIDNTNYHCLALEPGVGLQIKTAVESGPVWSTGISMGIWYDLKLSIDASGLMTGYLDGNVLGSFRPVTVIASGDVAVATLSAEAAFDDVVLTVP